MEILLKKILIINDVLLLTYFYVNGRARTITFTVYYDMILEVKCFKKKKGIYNKQKFGLINLGYISKIVQKIINIIIYIIIYLIVKFQ